MAFSCSFSYAAEYMIFGLPCRFGMPRRSEAKQGHPFSISAVRVTKGMTNRKKAHSLIVVPCITQTAENGGDLDTHTRTQTAGMARYYAAHPISPALGTSLALPSAVRHFASSAIQLRTYMSFFNFSPVTVLFAGSPPPPDFTLDRYNLHASCVGPPTTHEKYTCMSGWYHRQEANAATFSTSGCPPCHCSSPPPCCG